MLKSVLRVALVGALCLGGVYRLKERVISIFQWVKKLLNIKITIKL